MNKYCPWVKYCGHWCRFSLQFCATWKLLIPCFQQSELWIIQSKGQFGICTVISGEILCPPPIRLCPRTRALWPHSHIHSSRLAEGVARQRQNQVLSPHRSSKGTQEAATAWHHLWARSLILESLKNQLHILFLNSLCHYSFCMVLSNEIIEHEQLSALFTQPCALNNQLFVIKVPLTVRKKY